MAYLSRQKDRHKATEERKKDRHKATEERKKDRHKGKRESLPWAGEFIAFDGEGWDGKYCVLAMSGFQALTNPDGLTTLDCLQYLTDSPTKGNAAFVGFGLSYDFENILRDLPDELYKRLLEEYTDKNGRPQRKTVEWQGYTLMYIPRKMLEIKVNTGWKRPDGSEYIKTVLLQDVWGFFQSSFLAALKKWEIDIPAELVEGKESRQFFCSENMEKIVSYNSVELQKLVELMNKLRAADTEACGLLGLKTNHTPRSWYGPGARASNFLRQTFFDKEHPPFEGEIFESLRFHAFGPPGHEVMKSIFGVEPEHAEATRNQPFACAYYGGRIEAAAKGEFVEQMYDYDINSAYPYAFSLLPVWEPNDLIRVNGLDPAGRMGMYYVKWGIRQGLGYYPFPFRSANGNVFYPASGQGWYMSPEVHAAVDVFGANQVEIEEGFLLRDTDGAGSALTRLPDTKLCTAAKMMIRLADIRLEAKAKGLSAEKALKLTMNSCYGKTIQQVGSPRFLNFFAAAWITSTCRAMLLRAVGKDTDNSVISIMTDGLLTRKKLDLPIGSALGEWGETPIKRALQFIPGVYHLEEPDGKILCRYRGMSKDFNPEEALMSLYHDKTWNIKVRVFVTRSLALHMPNKFGNKRYCWVDLEKEERFSLTSKRQDGVIPAKNKYQFFPAKGLHFQDLLTGSLPYKIKQKPAELQYDEATSMEELLGPNRFQSILDQELFA